MKKKLYVLLAVCFIGMSICAEPITKQQAQQIAAGWFMGKSSARRMAPSPKNMKTDVVFKAVNATGDPYLYAVSNGSNGYVLVSGDDRAPSVLGYVEKGFYDEGQLPENMRSWLRHYIDEIELLQKYNLKSPEQTIADCGEPIAKTTTSLWDQLAPYNNECPMVSTYNDAACTQERHMDLRAATGCAATALAQVLYMWRDEYAKPEVKEGKLSQDIPARTNEVCQASEMEGDKNVPVWLKFSTEAIPASTTIDWGNLIDVYTERDSEGRIIMDESAIKGTAEQQAAVARLMRICGALFEMSYGTVLSGGSGAAPEIGVKGLALYMNFPNVRIEQRYMYDYNGWIQRLYDELKVAKAVFFGGNSSDSGHAFVIDGYYKEDLFHVNWGWSGLANEAIEDGGYYRINSLLPINQGTGGSVVNDGFRMMQSFFTGVYPNAAEPTTESTVTTTILNTNQIHTTLKDGKLKLHLYGIASNQSCPVIDAQTAICMENESGYKSLHIIGDELETMYISDTQMTDTVLTWTGLTDGDYNVRMYYRTSLDDVEWKLCNRAEYSYIRVQVRDGVAHFHNTGSFEVELLSNDLKQQYTKGEDVSFNLKYKMNKGTFENFGMMSFAFPIKQNEEGEFVEDDTREECTGVPPFIINAKEGDEMTLSATFSADGLEVGHYELICASMLGFFPTDLRFEVVESGSTGIELLEKNGASRKDDATWYDLQGRKLSAKPTAPGVYIVGGSKRVVK